MKKNLHATPLSFKKSPINHKLLILPYRSADAFTNMADDLLLLEHFPQPDTLRFRPYGWTAPAFTFGYSQKYRWVKTQIERAIFLCCRRPTGGGIVDHRTDWTYSFVIPSHHPIFGARAAEIYRLVHQALAEALTIHHQPASLAPCQPTKSSAVNDLPGQTKGELGLCFANLSSYDITLPLTGEKIAGAALKRSRAGLLLQGSIDRAVASAVDNWTTFPTSFLNILAQRFQAVVEPTPFTPLYPQEIQNKVARLFYSKDWNQRR